MNEPTGFDAWWCFWREHKRHTDGRGKCRKEYQRQLNNGASPDDLFQAAQWHVRNTKDLAFIPLAATWLNSEAWRDEAPKEREWKQRLESRQTERSSNVVHINPQPAQPSAFLRSWAAKTN